MPAQLTYPGVYVEEVPSGVRTITGVATSVTAFVGPARWGPIDQAVKIYSFPQFEREFGGIWVKSALGYAVRDFFLNGGGEARIVRVIAADAVAARFAVDEPEGDGGGNGGGDGDGNGGGNGGGDGDGDAAPAALTLEAASKGAWGNELTATIDPVAPPKAGAGESQAEDKKQLFKLTVRRLTPSGEELARETFLNVSTEASAPRYLPRVLEEARGLVRVAKDGNDKYLMPETVDKTLVGSAGDTGKDGGALDAKAYTDPGKGFRALDQTDIFNLLVIPPPTRGGTTPNEVYQAALAYCREHRAVLLVDPPDVWAKASDVDLDSFGFSMADRGYGAIYFPRLYEPDPEADGQTATFTPSGAVAGVIASTDTRRGVWKAPAGTDAGINGTRGLTVVLTDPENGDLNQDGVNCLREFPVYGRVVWGARTLKGADQLADEYKYLPVRRLALNIEESLFRGTKWVVFEPNDEPLWSQIRLNVGVFMHNLFRQGAFQGATPAKAYFVKCDGETTTQADIDLGIVNIDVGFAPLKPAEFVVIRIQQIAGQLEA